MLTHVRDHRGTVISTLGITQTLAWTSNSYLTAVFADRVSSSLDISRNWFLGIFCAALLLAGLVGPLAGRMIDRHGGRTILAATNLVFAAGLGTLAIASNIIGLAAAWASLGIGMGFGLYEAAFAAATGLYGRDAQCDHLHHALRRFRRSRGLANQRVLHRPSRLAGRLQCLGVSACSHRLPDEPLSGSEAHAAGRAGF